MRLPLYPPSPVPFYNFRVFFYVNHSYFNFCRFCLFMKEIPYVQFTFWYYFTDEYKSTLIFSLSSSKEGRCINRQRLLFHCNSLEFNGSWVFSLYVPKIKHRLYLGSLSSSLKIFSCGKRGTKTAGKIRPDESSMYLGSWEL